MKELNKSHCIILPVVWVGEEYVVEPNGWVDERYVDPAFSLLPVQPPKVNPLSLPCPKHYLTPVSHKLEKIISQFKLTTGTMVRKRRHHKISLLFFQ